MSAKIRIKGMKELMAKIDTLEQMEGVRRAMRAAGVHVKGKASEYAPSSEANQPNQRRWYERGYGSRWLRADGSVGGLQTSETLGKRWTNRERNRGLTQVIGNNASYGPYVQDADFQAAFHKRRGWKTTQTVVKEESDRVTKFLVDAIDDILEE